MDFDPELKRMYKAAKPQWIDPHSVDWGSHRPKEKYVQRYMDNPNWKSFWNDDSLDPFVVIRENGQRIAFNGKHRATAAIRKKRKVWGRVYDMRKK